MVLEEYTPSKSSVSNESLYKIKIHVNVPCMADIHVMQWSETMHVRSQSDLRSARIETLKKHASRGFCTASASYISRPIQKKGVQKVTQKACSTQDTEHLLPILVGLVAFWALEGLVSPKGRGYRRVSRIGRYVRCRGEMVRGHHGEDRGASGAAASERVCGRVSS